MIKIRAANIQDSAALDDLMWALHQEHHEKAPDLCKPAAQVMQEKSIQTYLTHPECLVYLAEDVTQSEEDTSPQVVGFICGSFASFDSPIHPKVLLGNIDEFYLLPTMRQQGIGRQLLTQIESVFESYGVEKIAIEVFDFNHVARSFYQEHKFEPYIHCLMKKIN